MFYWLIELSIPSRVSDVPGAAQRISLHHLPHRRGDGDGALFRIPVRTMDHRPFALRQGKGQPIRTDGPQSHLISKKGTPTMGGLMILSGLVVPTLIGPIRSTLVWILS